MHNSKKLKKICFTGLTVLQTYFIIKNLVKFYVVSNAFYILLIFYQISFVIK